MKRSTIEYVLIHSVSYCVCVCVCVCGVSNRIVSRLTDVSHLVCRSRVGPLMLMLSQGAIIHIHAVSLMKASFKDVIVYLYVFFCMHSVNTYKNIYVVCKNNGIFYDSIQFFFELVSELILRTYISSHRMLTYEFVIPRDIR